MTADWRDHRVVLARGQYNQSKMPFETISLRDLNATATLLGPTIGAKSDANAIIPSTYHESDARSASAQKQFGRFCAIIGDIDKGNHPKSYIEASVSAILGEGIAHWGHSTASSKHDDQRWRAVIPLAAALRYEDWKILSEIIFERLAKAGIVTDRAMLRPSQLSFMPNVPPEFCDESQKPLYYEAYDREGEGLSLETFADEIQQIRETAERGEIFTAAAKSADWVELSKQGRGPSGIVIDAFKAAYDMADLLVKYGYEQSPQNVLDWRSPMQTSSTYATRIMTDHDGRQKFVSLSASDADAHLGLKSANDYRFGDAFDLFRFFEHRNDFEAALNAAKSLFAPEVAALPGAIPVEDDLPEMPPPFPGEMKQIVDAALAVSAKPQPEYALMAALIGMASACDGHYALPSGARLNLYCLGVGETGTGKDMPQTVVKAIALEAKSLLFGEAGSGQGLEDHLVSYCGAIMVIDEISVMLSAALAKNAPAHLKSAEAMYLKLFSASRSVYITRLLAKSQKGAASKTIQHPCLSLFGFATPQGLGAALGEGAITGGLLGRMLMAQAHDDVVVRRPYGSFLVPAEVKEKLRQLEAAVSDFFMCETERVIGIPDDVDERLNQLIGEFDTKMKCMPTEGERALLARSYEKVERIAGILAVWDNPDKPHISHQMVDWAVAFVHASDANLLSFVGRYMHGSPVHANAARVVEMIKKILKGTISTQRPKEAEAIASGYAPQSTLLRACKWIDRSALDLSIAQLEAQGDIVCTKYKGIAVLAFPSDDLVVPACSGNKKGEDLCVVE